MFFISLALRLQTLIELHNGFEGQVAAVPSVCPAEPGSGGHA